MKHIKTINELYKSTYISAADKLDKFTKKNRSNKLKNWAVNGASEFANLKNSTDKEHYYPFRFDHHNIHNLDKRGANFYITGTSFFDNSIEVNFMNDYGDKTKIFIEKYNTGSTYPPYLWTVKYDGKRGNEFEFTTRREAVELIKFLKATFEDGYPESKTHPILDAIKIHLLYEDDPAVT